MINTFALLIPVFLLIAFIEWYILNWNSNNKDTQGSFFMNMSIGAIDQIGSLVHFGILFFVLSYVYNHFRLIEIKSLWYQWVLAYIAIDFISYWYHRMSHRINLLWAGHITHHSSEFFNFSNGFRTSPFQGFNRIIFLSVLPIFGFSPAILVVTFKISGLYDFIVHTEYIPKLKYVEKIFITPSLHRVHHGKNDLYIDKNYGSTFSIWDRLFGTYQEETEKVNYGITGTYVDNNPFWAIGHYYFYLWKNMFATKGWVDKIKVLIMPPDWKPNDAIETKTTINKKEIEANIYLKYYAMFQITFCSAAVILLLIYKDFLSTGEFIICALIAIINMSKAAMIFKNNINIDFEKHELIWLIFEATVVLVSMLYYPFFPLNGLMIFLLISVVLIVMMQTTFLSQKIN